MNIACDVVWFPTTAELNCSIERVHFKFLNKLPLTNHSKFSFTLTERRKYHTALKSVSDFTYLHNIYDLTGHVSCDVNHFLFLARVFQY